MADPEWKIFELRKQYFVLWTASEPEAPPILELGVRNGPDDSSTFSILLKRQLEPHHSRYADNHLWKISMDNLDINSSDIPTNTGKVYHYWFRVRQRKEGTSLREVLVTDPFATAVDYRLRRQIDGSFRPPIDQNNVPGDAKFDQPASVIKIIRTTSDSGSAVLGLQPCDPNGTDIISVHIPDQRIDAALNKELVIYELPVSWAATTANFQGGKDRPDRGTFKDVLDLFGPSGNLSRLGINALELLPLTDSKYTGEWGYAPAHYFAPDWDFGLPGHTAASDLAKLASYCLEHGIRLIDDLVMAFGHDPYIQIGFNTFHIEPKRGKTPEEDNDKVRWNHNPDAWQSPPSGGRRDGFGGSSWRYNRLTETIDPEDLTNKFLTPARAFHKAHLAWWMQHYKLGGVRLDSVNNIGNWDFIKEFHDAAYTHHRTIYGPNANDEKFIVIGEELAMPVELVQTNHLTALWNEKFQPRLRALIVGQALDDNYFWTVSKMLDPTHLNDLPSARHFSHGLQVVNYITSHDTEGDRKDRLWNYLDDWGVTQHSDKAQRCKLAFACLLTAIGIPMIFAGEEFADEGDEKFEHPYKQRDPIDWWRGAQQPWRSELFECVARLVELRKRHAGLTELAGGSCAVYQQDSTEGGNPELFAWVRGRPDAELSDKIVVVANFSDKRFPAGYRFDRLVELDRARPRDWAWYDVIADSRIDDFGTANLIAWDVKVYKLVQTVAACSEERQNQVENHDEL